MIFVISAPSGAGKTTLITRLLRSDDRFMFSISTTTRKIRPGESHGVNYYFVSKEKFLEMIENDEFFEWAEVYGNYYGTSKKEIDRILKSGKFPLFDVDVQGSKILRKKLPDAVFIFIIPPSLNILKARLIGRQTESEEELDVRLKNAAKEINEYKNFDYVIVNTVLEESMTKLKAIVEAEICKTKNIEADVKKILEDFNDYST
ncbi:MAG: Guanylate kinase [Spirochaetes bacterium ADurb.Bin218]|jgi:guanylate kinase|nr:guanylate kinase [Spirochaetota bacterium]OQA98930.1 MAG: Guanylate kinase [Spirochaetes bacterium ADurb.Bin218]HOQ12410.1 guanylate kinase [Spirochaetota bacterium]HOV08570.1 guanylate kinase [Spirochaetota bacterium]HPX90805.1 guanylate kinase [Spirochaetota bacterium]